MALEGLQYLLLVVGSGIGFMIGIAMFVTADNIFGKQSIAGFIIYIASFMIPFVLFV